MSARLQAANKKILSLEMWLVVGICLITYICFSHVVYNTFLYWDDNAFISGNPDIRRLSWMNIKLMFTKEYGANWQPLTMLSYAINYYFSKLSPTGYFFTNVLLHVANTALVFFVIKKLLLLLWKETKPTDVLLISAAISLWFGIHPMHVESVAWLFERKDVLYVFFYLFALLVYLKYLAKKRTKWFVYSLFLFIAASLSKPMAIVFPASLILIDFLFHGKFERKALLQKIPFLLVSLLMGIYTIHTQKVEHAFMYSFSLPERIMIASYSFLAYIGKLFLPIHLCAMYPFPFNPGASKSFIFYLAPLLVLLITILPLYFAYKKNKTWFRVLLFSYGFYLINVAIVLQFFPAGQAIISDRYSYMCYIGLFFMIAYFLKELLNKASESRKTIMQTVVILYTIVWGYLCYQRTLMWQNTEPILSDIIKQYPNKVNAAYKYLGIYYAKAGRTQDAFNCYDALINQMHEKDADVYCNMGSVYMDMNKPAEALQYLKGALQLDSNSFMSYRNIGIIYASKGDYDNAFKYYNCAMKIYPSDEGLYNNISFAHVATKQYAAAINDYNFLIHLSPDNALYYFNRGVAEYSMNNINDATSDFEKSLSMPVMVENQSYNLPASSAYNLSVIFKNKGDNDKATYYTEQAKQLGYKF